MAIHYSVMLFACMASSTIALKHKGITVAKEQKITVSPDVSSNGFNLADIFRGGSAPQGLQGWTNIFEKIGSGASIESNDLDKAMEASHVSASMDPHLQQELGTYTVQTKLQNLTQSPELLMKTVQENDMIKQLEGTNPAMAKLIRSPGVLQKIFSPEMIQQMQNGHPSDAAMQQILGMANVSGISNASLPEGLELKQVRAGDGKTFPQNGDDVGLEYKGYLKDGTLFGSGKFSFHIGASEAIQGWDIAVRHMSLGERGVLQVPAALGYGSDGAGPIPPNTDLVFDVSLQEIKRF